MSSAMTMRPSTSTQISPVELLHNLVQMILAAVPADMACICRYREDVDEMETLAYGLNHPEAVYPKGEARVMLKELMKQLPITGDPQVFTMDDLLGTGFQSALAFPLSLPDQVIGILALFNLRPAALSMADAEKIIILVNLARSVVENLHLYEALAQSLIVTHSIKLTAQMIAQSPSPQQIVDALHDHLFDTHITCCAMLLYGPLSEDRPYGPYDYLEIQGTWSLRRGSGVALRTRIYLKDYPDLLKKLDEHRPLVIDDMAAFQRRLDSYARSLLRAERIASLTIVPLHAGTRRMGLLLVGTHKPHTFSAAELESYQTVSEFLAISTMSQVLQQQHDLVQQGRSALLNAVRDGVVMVLPDATGARVLTVNKRFTEFFDLNEEEAQGALLADLLDKLPVPESVRRELRPLWLEVPVQDTLEPRGTFHYIHSSGIPLDIEWNSAPVFQDHHPYPLGRIFTFHDVTAERAAEHLRAAVLSNVSHELGTPLQNIQGFAEMILELGGENLPVKLRGYTGVIFSSAKHLSNVLKTMMVMARADAGALELNMRQIHLPDIVIDAVAQLELKVKAREQLLIMELDDELPPVSADPNRLLQVLLNLINNAVKYSPAGGRIVVTASYIRGADALPASAPPDAPLPAVMVSIVDEGPGLNHGDVEQVFMPLFRAKEARAQPIDGTGLGLAIARSFIGLHRGYIWAEAATEERPGGRFMFVLPTIPRRD